MPKADAESQRKQGTTMNEPGVAVTTLEDAIHELQNTESGGDGMWFEDLVQRVAPLIPWWEITAIDKPEPDDGIDAIATTRDGGKIPIQAKAESAALAGRRVTSFLSKTLGDDRWNVRWVVTRTDIHAQLRDKLESHGDQSCPVRIKVMDEELGHALDHWRAAMQPVDPRTPMQDKAVAAAIDGLDSIRGARHPGWNSESARGKVVMPCGTGKTRVGWRLADVLCGRLDRPADGLTVVLAPSIGLVRQLQREWKGLSSEYDTEIDTLCVCSKTTPSTPTQRRLLESASAFDAQRDVSLADDPTLDLSGLSRVHLSGDVQQTPAGISEWLREKVNSGVRRVVFSTYQSAHHTAAGLRDAGMIADLLIADEAHRTAGIKPKRKSDEERVKNFTVCHRDADMPARNRVYMTATPRSLIRGATRTTSKHELVSMDDEATFGPDLFRLSYSEAVGEKFLTDYRIIAVVPPASSTEIAQEMARRRTRTARAAARKTSAKRSGKAKRSASLKRNSESLALRKLAYGMVLAGGVEQPDGTRREIKSSIAFCNRIDHSEDLSEDLDHEQVREWLREQAATETDGEGSNYRLFHRDASSRLDKREEALNALRTATAAEPVGVTNVGIFGEGIDTPALDAVAFIEARKSPVDVMQAVGRAMRLSSNKDFGYIVVPLEIPLGKDPEAWLESRQNDDGYKELAQILVALRAHDGRIEDSLEELLQVHMPADEDEYENLVTIRTPEGYTHAIVTCGHGEIEDLLKRKPKTKSPLEMLRETANVRLVEKTDTVDKPPAAAFGIDGRKTAKPLMAPIDVDGAFTREEENEPFTLRPPIEKIERVLEEAIAAGRKKPTITLRAPRGRSLKKKGSKGTTAPTGNQPAQLRLMTEISERGDTLKMRILENSGLQGGTRRDFNMLAEIVRSAARKLRADNLEETLATKLQLLKPDRNDAPRADGCTVTALLLTTAALVQARLEKVGTVHFDDHALTIERIATAGNASGKLMVAFDEILSTDYKPVFEPARDLLRHLTYEVRKTENLNDAVRGIATSARDIADNYAEMGADYAGELFNRVMGDQKSDGAYFTRPLAGTLLAGLAIGATDAQLEALEELRVLDPACGSGTLLTSWLQEIKHAVGGDPDEQQELHRKMVEENLVGLDVNETSLQLAGSQMIIGDPEAAYEKMHLYAMKYARDSRVQFAPAGSLELLGEDAILARLPEHKGDEPRQRGLVSSIEAEQEHDDKKRDGPHPTVVDKNIRRRVLRTDVVLTNPPFVTRDKLGAKFGTELQHQVRRRIDDLERGVVVLNPEYDDFCEGKTTGPLYALLGLLTMNHEHGVLGMVIPTAGLMVPSGEVERQILARELDIRWVVTCHEAGNGNISQSGITESLVIGTRRRRESQGETQAPTTFVSLRHFPRDIEEAVLYPFPIIALIRQAERRGRHIY